MKSICIMVYDYVGHMFMGMCVFVSVHINICVYIKVGIVQIRVAHYMCNGVGDSDHNTRNTQ